MMKKTLMPEYKCEQAITLKPFTVADIDDFMEWATDDELTKFMMWDTYTSRESAKDFFRDVVEKHAWFKAICLGDKVIGSITLDKGKEIHSCKAELGYMISRKYWGKGFATQAVNLAAERGFEELGNIGVQRIEAFVDPVNVASQRVLEKNGFVKEGNLRSCLIHKEVVKDRLVYSILRLD